MGLQKGMGLVDDFRKGKFKLFALTEAKLKEMERYHGVR